MTKPLNIVKHRLSNIDPVDKMATCAECGRTQIFAQTKKGRTKVGWRCSTAVRSWTAKRRTGFDYTKAKKDACDFCGFVAVDPCQLDVDHIDGDRFNNAASNLQTLCANCHRLKSKMKGEFAGYTGNEAPAAPPRQERLAAERTELFARLFAPPPMPISPPVGPAGGAQPPGADSPGATLGAAGGATAQPPPGGPPGPPQA